MSTLGPGDGGRVRGQQGDQPRHLRHGGRAQGQELQVVCVLRTLKFLAAIYVTDSVTVLFSIRDSEYFRDIVSLFPGGR